VIVPGELYNHIYVGFMSIVTLNALYMWCRVYIIMYKMVELVFGSHNSSGFRDRRLKFLK
jgi:hypothetical protein